MMPEHSFCRVCIRRIARFSDRERWHHNGGGWTGHAPEPVDDERKEMLNRVAEQYGMEN